MPYSVNQIIPINTIISPSGIGLANFSTAFIFAKESEGSLDEYFVSDVYRDYNSLSEVANDFSTTSEVYYMASRWFANVPTPRNVTVWMWDDTYDTALEVANKAANEKWRFWYFFDYDTINDIPTATALGAFADSEKHGIPITTSEAGVVDPQDDTDIGSVLSSAGPRFIFVGYKTPSSVVTDPSQKYAMIQLAAAFNKFNPEGSRTAITGEYQVLPGIIGDDLTATQYGALKDKNVAFFTQIELQGSVDNSRVINSKSMSSFGEFMDDVVNIAVLENRLQVAGYNYIANAGTKRGLEPIGYAGLLSALDKRCKQFYNNGALGTSSYIDPNDGQSKVAKYGYVILASAEDVLEITDEQKADREYPDTQILVTLARAGHVASITLRVE